MSFSFRLGSKADLIASARGRRLSLLERSASSGKPLEQAEDQRVQLMTSVRGQKLTDESIDSDIFKDMTFCKPLPGCEATALTE